MSFMSRKPALPVLTLLCVLSAALGCKSKKQPAPAKSAAPVQASAAPSITVPRNIKKSAPVPTGPLLVILPAQGVGPIRIGATTKTINRLMEAPCDLKTDEVCRYFDRAVEFFLKDDVTERIYVHRHGRSAGKDAQGTEREFGFFNGGLLPDVRFGMLPAEIRKVLGEPKKTEKVATPNPFTTVEREHYDGLVVEYDRIANGNLIFAGAIITKPAK
jgi:hypothetical protein